MNPAVAVLIGAVTASILALSGGTKLLQPAEDRSLGALGLPEPLSTARFASAWAVCELVVAAGLLGGPRSTAVPVAVIATGMFAAFLIVMSRAARLDEPVRCSCFGALDTSLIGPATVVRSAAFLTLAAITATASPGGSVVAQARALDQHDAGLLQLGALMIATLITVQVMGRRRTDDPGAAPSHASLSVRSPLPETYLTDLFGGRHDVLRWVGDQHTVLVFLSTSCAACQSLADDLPEWRARLADNGTALRVVTSVPPARAIAHYPRLGSFLHQDEQDRLADHLEIPSLPAAVHLGRDGGPTVSDGPAIGAHAISVLMDNALAATRPATTGSRP